MEALIDFTNCPSFEHDFDKYKKEELWNEIKKWLEYEYLLAVIATDTPVPEGLNVKTNELTYSILRCWEDEKGLRLIKLRNLWGVFTWKGDWSKFSKKWTPEMEKKVNP